MVGERRRRKHCRRRLGNPRSWRRRRNLLLGVVRRGRRSWRSLRGVRGDDSRQMVWLPGASTLSRLCFSFVMSWLVVWDKLLSVQNDDLADDDIISDKAGQFYHMFTLQNFKITETSVENLAGWEDGTSMTPNWRCKLAPPAPPSLLRKALDHSILKIDKTALSRSTNGTF